MSDHRVAVTVTATVTWDDGSKSIISMTQSDTSDATIPIVTKRLIGSVGAKTVAAVTELENEITS